jgi:hypothetical protein
MYNYDLGALMHTQVLSMISIWSSIKIKDRQLYTQFSVRFHPCYIGVQRNSDQITAEKKNTKAQS